VPALIAIGLGLALGIACDGSVRALSAVRLRGEWALLVLFVAQAVARGRLAGLADESSVALAVWATTTAVLVLLLIWNLKVQGMAVAAVGTALNGVVVLANGGMPVALAVAGQSVRQGYYLPASQWTAAAALGDVLPLTLGGRATYLVSAGDVLIGVGIIALIVHVMVAEASPMRRLQGQ
jgi:hypothetical protein